MEQRISLVTLGVRDLRASAAFYQALGWTPGGGPQDADVVFFQAAGIVLALWSRTALAEDSCVVDTGGWGGVTLAQNVRDPSEVDAVLASAEAAGARIGRAGAPTVWGGYSGIFCDPDGHPWEVAHNPFWRITDDGATLLGAEGTNG
jgi:predicted lactoylglutathione lyase